MHFLSRAIHLTVILWPIVCLTSAEADRLRIALEPGEGTILLIGRLKDRAQVKARYLSSDSPVPEGILNSLLLGFYGGAERLVSDSPEFVDRALATYRAAGATTVWAYNANMEGGQTSPASRFAALAAKHGLKAILEPGDVYFRHGGYWAGEGHGFVKDYRGPEDYMNRYLMPRLRQWAPGVRDDKNIWAWGPAEEMPAEDEMIYVGYKKAFKELLPNHLLYQLDSQQCIFERIRHKWPPYPDIVGLDCYPWCTETLRDGVSTPDYAARWAFGYLKGYPGAAYELLAGAPAVFVAQGCAELNWIDEKAGKELGWETKEGLRPPKLPNVVWRPEVRKFSYWNRYLAPTNAWRLQSWLGICAGFKGLSFWSAGPADDREALKSALKKGEGSVRVCLIDNKMRTLPYLKEVADSWKEIRRFEKLILGLHPAHICHEYTVEGQRIFTNTFRDKAGREYLIVVNGDIIRYDDHNPEWLDWPKTKLAVNDDGELVNYTPLRDRRTIDIELKAPDVELYDLRQDTIDK